MSKTNWIREDIRTVERAAENGNVQAQVELAKRYFTGRDTSRNPKEGFIWVQHASTRGNAEALHLLGHCYATGTGTQSSGRKGFECFVKAAFQDHAVATYNLGICYEYGIGTDRDSRMAYSLYERSARLGYSRAKHILVAGLWNQDPEDKESERRDKVLGWYAEQARKGDELASKNLVQARRNKRVDPDKEFSL